jgi:hypothetical protein
MKVYHLRKQTTTPTQSPKKRGLWKSPSLANIQQEVVLDVNYPKQKLSSLRNDLLLIKNNVDSLKRAITNKRQLIRIQELKLGQQQEDLAELNQVCDKLRLNEEKWRKLLEEEQATSSEIILGLRT